MGRLGAMVAAVLVAATTAGAAGADGLPVGDVDVGPSGIALPAGEVRYVTLPARGDTLVAAVEQDGGRVQASRLVDGRYTIPAVALDGTAAGLSGDGLTLVLIRPRKGFPRARTPLAVLDTRRLRVREEIVLEGDFSFDALSPDGSLLYLVQYVDPGDPARYVVRGYDLRARRLLPEPVVDPKVFGDLMRGLPLTRATSADGRWAYTLYDGGGHPFVHALDTADRSAACIVLDALAGREDLMDVRLALAAGGRELHAVAGGETLAVVDTETLRVREPAGEAPPEPAAAEEGGPGSWPLAALPAAAALLLGGLAVRRRRRPAIRN